MDTHRIDNPYTGELVAERRFLGDAEVEGLVTRAFRAHKSWARTPSPTASRSASASARSWRRRASASPAR